MVCCADVWDQGLCKVDEGFSGVFLLTEMGSSGLPWPKLGALHN